MSDEPVINGEIESQILAILSEHPKLTFTALAEAVPEHRWRELLGALNRLRQRYQIDMSALPLDYEVVLGSRHVNRSCKHRELGHETANSTAHTMVGSCVK